MTASQLAMWADGHDVQSIESVLAATSLDDGEQRRSSHPMEALLGVQPSYGTVRTRSSQAFFFVEFRALLCGSPIWRKPTEIGPLPPAPKARAARARLWSISFLSVTHELYRLQSVFCLHV